ncbi:MAG TPA: TlpA disulfide reductase family protein, partial [Lacipirellulaceae bacterium]|nr:TlpA disulfide reductase family protein [Lacipirellulaceae bacterium]
MSRTLLARVVLLGVVALTQHQAAAQDGDAPGADHAAAEAQAKAASGPSAALTIGDAAPALDISDWLQDAQGRFPHVTNLEPGKIYIVEFWATWCGPCVASMPHVSELQQKYADKGVQVVSVSTEPVETITEFLSKTAAGSEKTYAEITADYCLTTDPDGSVHADYMEAAAQNGIPCAFLVGKEGKVEWIGHPMSIDDVLEQLIAGQWDREAFRKTFEFQQRLEKAMQEVMRLASQQDAAGAYAKLDELSAGAHDESARELIDRARAQVGTMVFYHALEQDQAKAAE